MAKEIKFAGVKIDDQLSSNISGIMNDNIENASPFMQLFWDQQTRLLRNGEDSGEFGVQQTYWRTDWFCGFRQLETVFIIQVMGRKPDICGMMENIFYGVTFTYEGIKITVHSVIEATKFLLQSGFEFVLTEKFNQDVVEKYFSRQRSLGKRNDNPSLYQFGYNANTIRMQCSIVPVTGNSKGTHKQKRNVSWYSIDNTKLKKRSKSIIKND
eukprot:gene2054-2330_t